MKNVFKKAVSLTVALSTVAALSVSAFAAEISTGSASYSADGVSVAVTGYDNLAAGQYAVAIVPAGETTYTDDMIYYVNQADEEAIVTILANMLVKEELAAGDYEVRIGNNANDDLNVLTFTVAAESNKDYISSTDTSKGTIATNVASVTDASMGAAVGYSIIALALDTTVYPNAGTAMPAYSIAVVDANGTAVEGAKVYYSAERAKYVALVPTTVTDYKFEVVADGEANGVITKYGNMNEDAAGLFNIADYAQFIKVYKKAADAVVVSDAKKALIADVSGDGRVNIADYAQFIKAYKKQTYSFAVLTK